MADTRSQAEQALIDSRRLFQRHLSTWAMDCLALRQRGLDRPSARTGMYPAQPAFKIAA